MTMKLIAAVAVATLAFAAPAFAQTKPDAAKTEAKKVDIPADYWKKQKPTQYLIKDRLIGQSVKNKEGKVIGDIEDVIVGDENKVVGVIMGVGGFLGAGEKKVAVRYRALEFSAVDGKKVITLPSATKEVLGALLPYERTAPAKSLLEKAKDKAIELKDKAGDAAAKVKENAAPMVEKAKEAAKGAVEKAKDLAAPKPAAPAPAAKP
jgi:hypothetical protein